MFRKDTGKMPFLVPAGTCNPAVPADIFTTIQGGGTTPPTDNAASSWGVNSNEVALSIIMNLPGAGIVVQPCYNNNAKNYMSETSPDPWGRQYIVNSADFANPALPSWVISAGPNGIIDTPRNNNATLLVGSDDIGIRIQ